MKLFAIFVIAISAIVHANTETLMESGCSCADKMTIIDKHNELRKIIATGGIAGIPEASNMQRMVWDDSLEATAQMWANRMQFVHNTNFAGSKFGYVGENIYISYYSKPNSTQEWDRAIQSWFDENKKGFNYENVHSFHGVGHFTQVIWANTIYVGCGFSYFKNEDNEMYGKLYVCDYGPGGNIHNEHVYETGPGCEDLCCKDQCGGKMYGEACG